MPEDKNDKKVFLISEEEPLRKRLYSVLKEKGGPFWESAGVYKSATMHGVITKNTMPGGFKLLEICKVGDISPIWLFFGIGPKEKSALTKIIDESALLKKDDELDVPLLSEKIRILTSELPAVISAISDIKEQQKILQNLTILETLIPVIKKKLEEYYHRKNEYFLMFNRDGNLISVNDLFLRKTGLKREEILNTFFFIPVHEEDKNKMLEGLERIYLGLAFEAEAVLRVRMHDGKYELQRWVSFVRLSPSGEYLGRQSVGRSLDEGHGI
ncbi:MAG: PAS domain S-box protein [Desulforegulaceae bacterium]|nr:PAS domain S-box protein [Desulforegulaceae bacterium]